MKRIPYSDPCVNGSSVHPRSSRGCAEPSIEQRVNLSLSAANQALAALRQQHGVGVNTSRSELLNTVQSRGEIDDHTKKRVNSHTVDNWLSPLRQIDVQPTQIPQPKTRKSPTTIALSPQLLAAMLRMGSVVAGRVWLLARVLDEDGRGWITVDQLRDKLTKKESGWRVCGWRRLRQILNAGRGQFWQRDDRGRLWLFGQAQVAANLEVERFSRTTIELPFDILLSNIAEIKAAFYATQHISDAPISRATLTEITAIPERTQRHYDNVIGTEKTINWGIGAPITEANCQEHAYQYGGATFIFKDKQGQARLARQLPNSYCCPYQITTKSQKRLNQKLQDLVKQGRRGNVQFERRYFADGRSLMGDNATSGYMRDRRMAGRTLWIFFD